MKTLLWIQGLSCGANTQSFLCMEHQHLFEKIAILYHPLSDKSLEESVRLLLKDEKELDILIVEGAIGKSIRHICSHSFPNIVKILSSKAKYVVALGDCASFGGVHAKSNIHITGLQFRFKEFGGLLGKTFLSKSSYPVINIAGCPAHPEWIFYVISSLLEDKNIELDEFNRPKDIFKYLTHNGCLRNEYFEWKVESKEFGTKEGCLFYELGCRGPLTHSSCNKILWNGVSSKTRVGTPCVGCTEFDFPRENMLKTEQMMGLPKDLPIGVSKRGYILLSGIAKTFTPDRLKNKL